MSSIWWGLQFKLLLFDAPLAGARHSGALAYTLHINYISGSQSVVRLTLSLSSTLSEILERSDWRHF